MVDVVVSDVPGEVVAAIDAQARRAGLSRTAFLRRQMVRMVGSAERPATAEGLSSLGERFADLADAEVMREAWE